MNKPLRRHRSFEKNFRKRFGHDGKIRRQLHDRVQLFLDGERGYPLNDHALTGVMIGKRAFSITSDIRVVYIETDKEIVFLDIGTHSQVY